MVGIMSIVQIVLGVFLIIELGLTSYLVSETNKSFFGANNTPSQFSFMLFNSVWSILVLIYLGIATTIIESIYNSIAALVLLGLSTLFWFAGSIALAAFIHVPTCHGNIFCTSAQAAVAFGFFIWAIFTGLVAVDLLGALRGGSVRKPGVVHA